VEGADDLLGKGGQSDLIARTQYELTCSAKLI